MNAKFVTKNFGDVIDLGTCLVGKNLNVSTVRGYAKLHHLAVISDADVYDMVDNPLGTQRDIKKPHARECLEYARKALDDAPESYPRFFPEILLNVRDTNVVEIYDVEDSKHLIDFTSFTDADDAPKFVGVRVLLRDYQWPKNQKSPRISRVDGNHRLYGTDEVLAQLARDADALDEDEFATLPFALLVGLQGMDEARLFRDINGEHEGMETAHLVGLEYRTADTEEMKHDPRLQPNWLAHQLAAPGMAFHNVVFMGGAKAGVKDQLGSVPPIKINTLRSTVAQQLQSSTTVATAYEDEVDTLLEILNNYWGAVAETFPEAWADKKNYILLQTIGLGGFARFGGYLIDRAFEDQHLGRDDFKTYLAPVRKKMQLRRDDFTGIAGAGGQTVVAKKLIEACEDLAVKAERAKKLLGKKADLGSTLASAAKKEAN